MTQSLTLRDYQVIAIDAIRDEFKKGNRKVLLHLATGGGKTLIFCYILKSVAERAKTALIAVRGTQLIAQASERLTREGVEHGIYQGGNSHSSWRPIQVCSIDTLYRRRIAPPADVIVIDEAHQTQGEGYKWFLAQYPNTLILAVSATPHLKKGLRHVADTVVFPISIQDLMTRGFLCRPRYFAPDTPDLTDVAIKNGEFEEKGLEIVMKKPRLIGNIVKNWLEKAEERRTIVFCVNIAHSNLVCQEFRSAGVAVGHVDAKTPERERKRLYEQLHDGTIKVLSNVGVLTTGFDCPPVSCLVLARPTMSYNLHIQIIGRGTRIYPDKENFIVFDHAGNIHRHGRIEDEQMCSIDPRPKRQMQSSGPAITNCEECLAIFPVACKTCPECGAANPKWTRDQPPATGNGELKEMIFTPKEPWELEVERLIIVAKNKKLKKGWIYFTLKSKFGEEIASMAWEKKIKRLRKWSTETRTPVLSEKFW